MPVTFLTDFSDKLSPMLVKELRQGMRARSFTMLFLGFQILMAFILLTTGASFDSDNAGAASSGIIFTLFSIAVLGIQPMRGASALSSEITANTIEMMVLTRLSAWRIVFGKWIAIVGQSALILTTIIPYLILRYFFGGMNLLGEMVFLVLIFLTSMALTAVMVGLSATSTKLARALPVVGFILLMNVVPDYLFRRGLGSGMAFFALSDWNSRIVVFSYVVFIAYLGWCSLSNGTSAIAPAAENHSTIRRLVALVLAVIVCVAGHHPYLEPELVMAFLAFILAPAFITALTEPAIILPPVCQPFLKRGLPGKLAAAFLLPGWPTGVFFTLLLAVISVGGIVGAALPSPPSDFDPELMVAYLGCFGSLLLPALLAAHYSKQEKKRFTNFMLFLVASLVLMVCLMMVAGINDSEEILWLFIWNPPVLLAMLSFSRFDDHDLALAAGAVDLVLMALLLGKALLGYRDYLRVFRESEIGMTVDAETSDSQIPGS